MNKFACAAALAFNAFVFSTPGAIARTPAKATPAVRVVIHDNLTDNFIPSSNDLVPQGKPERPAAASSVRDGLRNGR